MKCMICGLGPGDGVSLFRQNPKGEAGIWACWAHRREPVADEVDSIVAMLEKAGAQKTQ